MRLAAEVVSAALDHHNNQAEEAAEEKSPQRRGGGFGGSSSQNNYQQHKSRQAPSSGSGQQQQQQQPEHMLERTMVEDMLFMIGRRNLSAELGIPLVQKLEKSRFTISEKALAGVMRSGAMEKGEELAAAAAAANPTANLAQLLVAEESR